MKKVLIVDDETIIRVTLRTLIRWEDYHMQVVGDCNSGSQALKYLQENEVDLLITDVKMPEMSGIELLRRLKDQRRAPLTIMLSGYNEFDLVREAFRLGAYDYMLKEDMNEERMKVLLTEVMKVYGDEEARTESKQQESRKKRIQFPDKGYYGIAVFEIDDFKRQSSRFRENLTELLEKPMLELANQIPRVSRRGKLLAVQPGHYIFLYRADEKNLYRNEMLSLVRRMQAVWRDYMNITVSAAVCDRREAPELEAALAYGEKLLLLSPLEGEEAITAEWERSGIIDGIEEANEAYTRLLRFLYEINEPEFELEKQEFFRRLNQMSQKESEVESLRLIALLAMKFREYDDDFFAVFPEKVNYYEKLDRLLAIRELELWMNNYFSWVLEYLKQRLGDVHTDLILRAKRFMADNYMNPELTLKSVADYVGLNEKYFTTRFTKEAGNTFRDYLTGLRLAGAKRLLETTDLKMYEISDRCGYRNVEHFNRMFKKSFDISPGDYRREIKKT